MASTIDLGIDGIGPATLLARGGSAFVYLAEQIDFGRQVAVKVLFSALEDDATFQRFDRECRAIGAVSNHPNIVVVHGRGLTADERPYLVMEHRAGGSLAELLQVRGRLTEAEVIRIGSKIGTALEVAHAAGVLHRDVKPANILLSSYDEPALADFGIARIDGAHKTTGGVFSASVLHASREVLDNGEPTPRSDIYGLGSTLFELVTGRAAFSNPGDLSMWAVVNRVLTEDPPDPRASGVTDGLAAVLSRAMDPDPDRRHRTAQDLVDELRRLQPGAISAENPPARPLPAAELETLTGSMPTGRPSPDLGGEPVTVAGAGPPPATTEPADHVRSRRSWPIVAATVTVLLAMVVVMAAVGALLYGEGGGSTAQVATDEDRPESNPGAPTVGADDSADRRSEPLADDASTEDRLIASASGGSLKLVFPRAELGPLRANDPYLLDLSGGADGATFRIIVDDRAVTEPESDVPLFYPQPGRHRVQVQATTDQRVEISNVIEIYVSDRGPEPGYRANLSAILSEPENWPEALRQFDQMVADGHEDLELSLSTRREDEQLPYWHYYVDGFGDDREAAQAYCDGFGLDQDRCFVAEV